jgi:hypothetical protein
VSYDDLLADPGQHGMLPIAAFDVLRAWGCEGECFASPLNATLGAYCSLHADSDAHFGSAGSFFAFRPARGNFELNPPFTIQTDAVERHVRGLLEVRRNGAWRIRSGVLNSYKQPPRARPA